MISKLEAKNENLVKDKSFDFALLIIDCYKYLSSKNEYVLSKQLLRSGTSIGANIEEAQASQSRKDFLSKMSIASKEARETLYWIKLLVKSEFLDEYQGTNELVEEINSVINILTKIVKTVSSTTK